MLKNKDFLAVELSDVLFILLINVKIPTIVCSLTFMSGINFKISRAEHLKGFKTSGPVHFVLLFPSPDLSFLQYIPVAKLGVSFVRRCFRDENSNYYIYPHLSRIMFYTYANS